MMYQVKNVIEIILMNFSGFTVLLKKKMKIVMIESVSIYSLNGLKFMTHRKIEFKIHHRQRTKIKITTQIGERNYRR